MLHIQRKKSLLDHLDKILGGIGSAAGAGIGTAVGGPAGAAIGSSLGGSLGGMIGGALTPEQRMIQMLGGDDQDEEGQMLNMAQTGMNPLQQSLMGLSGNMGQMGGDALSMLISSLMNRNSPESTTQQQPWISNEENRMKLARMVAMKNLYNRQ